MEELRGCERRGRLLISFQIGRVGGCCKFPETAARSLSMFNVGPRSTAAPTLTQPAQYIFLQYLNSCLSVCVVFVKKGACIAFQTRGDVTAAPVKYDLDDIQGKLIIYSKECLWTSAMRHITVWALKYPPEFLHFAILPFWNCLLQFCHFGIVYYYVAILELSIAIFQYWNCQLLFCHFGIVDYGAFGRLHSHAWGRLTVAGVKLRAPDISANIFTHSWTIFSWPHS